MTTSTRSSSSTNNNSNSRNHNESEERNNNGNSPANIGTTNRVMQADEDFNIRFVNLVRTHKCLYDKKVPEYRNRDNQEKAWVLISKETRESVIHCKERWRNLRACLSRYIKQQSGSEPQHKPYYLTEHMAFLLPFLKSTRNSLDGNSSLATLFHLSQQHQHLNHLQQHPHQTLTLPHPHEEHMYCSTATNNNNNEEVMELKHSMSDNDDEETIDAFDPAVASTLNLQRGVPPATPTSHAASHHQPRGSSPARSDTASADSMQNFIPDVQLAESGPNLIYNDAGRGTPPPLHYHPHTLPHPMDAHHHHIHSLGHGHQHQFEPGSAKRIKTECEATSTMANGGTNFYGGLSVAELADMEFFRSILPDITALTPQQRRKFKIGILELIDDVVARYPGPERYNGGGCVVNGSGGSSSNGGGSSLNSTAGRQQRRSSGRDWRK
ncbi:probable serine/threonine-protein kinase DDB_G0277165 [Drosophila obscura]|uniref:probable serine/threonine-protein kinase DDB_G0277165 n=1 Tax=Drosophila obscura TaxID=7282 RepID=UPI000BA1130A|nr:probable serine/threonine-protein kinase DDB_G0277165 [Drosophila obscura]XP_022222604.1 probable serine/threonine-protein kinase DDB_G0277165 [Drosophila obscura]